MFCSPGRSQQIRAFAFSYFSAIALFWTSLTHQHFIFFFLLPFSLKYCNFYCLAPQFLSLLLQIWREAAHIFWVPCCSSGILPLHLSWIAANFLFPPIKFTLLLIPFKKLHSTISCTKSSFLYNTFVYFYPLQSLSDFSHYLVIPQKFLAKLSKNSHKSRWITPVNTYNNTPIHLHFSASKEDSAQGYQIQINQLFCNPLGTQTNPSYTGG